MNHHVATAALRSTPLGAGERPAEPADMRLQGPPQLLFQSVFELGRRAVAERRTSRKLVRFL